VVPAEDVDAVILLAAPLQQGAYVGEHHLLFVGHVGMDTGRIVVEIFHDGPRKVAARPHRRSEFLPDGRQAESEKVVVRVVQVGEETLHRDLVIGIGRNLIVKHHVGHDEEGGGIHAVGTAHFAYGTLPETEPDTEAAHKQ